MQVFSYSINLAMDRKKANKPAKKGKRMKKGKKKPSNDVSPEMALINEKKDLVAALIAKTGGSEEDILDAYNKFYDEFPSGEISEKEFLDQSKVVLV